MIKIWHNNNCSKSREAKTILENSNQEFKIFEYLKNDFTKDDLQTLIKQLNISDIRFMLRHKEIEYEELNINHSSKTQEEILNLVILNPKLIERPIIIKDDVAIIARPMENLITLLG